MTSRQLATAIVAVFIALLAPGIAAEESPDAQPQNLSVTRDGRPLTLELQPFGPLFAADYAEYENVDGELVPTDQATWANRESCRYVRAYAGSEATAGVGALRSCDGGPWEGSYFDAAGGWDLEQGVLYPAKRRGSCGVEGAQPPSSPTLGNRPAAPALALTQTNFLEVTLLTDRRLLEREQAGQQVPDPALSYAASAVLFDGAAFDRRILPLLVGVVAYEDSTPWGAPAFEPARAGGYLDRLNSWLRGEPAGVLNKDVVVLLSGWDFFGSTVGLATVEGACDLGLNAALVYGEGPLASVSQTLAHELGHAIGMWHDGSGNQCPNEGFVMQAIYSEDGPYPTEFSSCSLTSANQWLASGASSCISTDASPTFPQPVCGDGRVEGGEACDCGPDGCAGRNPCCNGDTCQLAAGALCAGEDGCCDLDTCAPRPAAEGFVCRAARSSCDVAEVCTGGAACPDDEIGPSGETCQDGSWPGACYRGECVSRGGYCEELAPLYFFDDPPFDAMCGGAAAGCQVMECLANRACVLTEATPPNGTECGSGSQCSDGSCRPSSQLDSPECVTTTDLDSDGVDACGDDADLCPTDPDKIEPGACGCLVAESDCAAGTPDEPDAGGGNSGTGGTGGTGGGSDGSDGGDVVVTANPSSSDSGCSSGGATPTAPALLVLLAFVGAFRRRRAD